VKEFRVIGARELGHVAIRARDFDTLYDFYTNKLGFPEFLRFHNSEGKLRLRYLRITDTQCIELFPDAVGEPQPKNHPGVFHICINVDDLDATLADLASRDVIRRRARGRTATVRRASPIPRGTISN